MEVSNNSAYYYNLSNLSYKVPDPPHPSIIDGYYQAPSLELYNIQEKLGSTTVIMVASHKCELPSNNSP